MGNTARAGAFVTAVSKNGCPFASAMKDPTDTWHELENIWRECVNALEQEYRHARAGPDAALVPCDYDATSVPDRSLHSDANL